MTKEEIRKIIIAVMRFSGVRLKNILDETKLKPLIGLIKVNFVIAIANEFPFVTAGKLSGKLFDSITNISQLVDYVFTEQN